MYSETSEYEYELPDQSARSDGFTAQNSFGLKADEAYDELMNKIDIGSISSQNEIESYVRENSKFLQIVSDSEGELTVEIIFDQGYRYFMDQNRIINVGNRGYKVFKNGLLDIEKAGYSEVEGMGSSIYYENVEDSNFYTRDVKIEFLTSRVEEGDPNDECGKGKDGQRTNGKQRTKVYAKTRREKAGSSYVIGAAYEARAFKKTAGIWFYVKRTLRGGYAIGLDYQSNGGVWNSAGNYNYLYPFKAKVIGETVFQTTVSWTGAGSPSYHLYGVHIWADTPSTKYASKYCNESYICSQYYCYPPNG